jgi:hypothetical protein
VLNCELETGISRFTKKRDLQLGSQFAACKFSLPRYRKSPIDSFIGRELEGESDVTLVVKAGYKVGGVSLGAQEAQVKFSGQEAMDAFWKSRDYITRRW